MTTPADIFANITDRFNSEAAADLNLSLVFALAGDGGGHWSVIIADGKVQVINGTTNNPAATIKMDANDYVAMTSGELDAMAAFMSGKIKVDGDLNSVMKFQQLFGM